MKKATGLKKRWYMLRDLIGLSRKQYNYKNDYMKDSERHIGKFYGQFDVPVDVLDGLTDSSCMPPKSSAAWRRICMHSRA
jgi:hypothetical protein